MFLKFENNQVKETLNLYLWQYQDFVLLCAYLRTCELRKVCFSLNLKGTRTCLNWFDGTLEHLRWKSLKKEINGYKLLTFITKSSILHFALGPKPASDSPVLNQNLYHVVKNFWFHENSFILPNTKTDLIFSSVFFHFIQSTRSPKEGTQFLNFHLPCSLEVRLV